MRQAFTTCMMLSLAIGSVVPEVGVAMPAIVAGPSDSVRVVTETVAHTTVAAAAVADSMVAAPGLISADTTAADSHATDATVADTITVAANATIAAPPGPPPGPRFGPANFEALRSRLARARHIRLQTQYRTFDLWQLQLSRDSVRFRIAGDEAGDEIRTLAWRDVRGIQVRGTHRGTGAKVGAIAVGAGCLVLLASMAADARWNFSWTDGWAPLLLSGGLVLTLAGALTGALAGSFVSKWENVHP